MTKSTWTEQEIKDLPLLNYKDKLYHVYSQIIETDYGPENFVLIWDTTDERFIGSAQEAGPTNWIAQMLIDDHEAYFDEPDPSFHYGFNPEIPF